MLAMRLAAESIRNQMKGDFVARMTGDCSWMVRRGRLELDTVNPGSVDQNPHTVNPKHAVQNRKAEAEIPNSHRTKVMLTIVILGISSI